jgi:hypothetical protein
MVGVNSPTPKLKQRETMLRKLTKKDKLNFYCFTIDNNISMSLFEDFVKQKKIAFVSANHKKIDGLIYLYKKDNNFYLKIHTSDKKIVSNLLKILFWNFKKELYAEIKVKDKVGFILKENGFRIIGKDNTTFLLCYNPAEKRKKYGSNNHSRNNYVNSRQDKR